MINDERGNTVFRKLSTINRRMFIFSAVKAVVFFGIVGRLFSLQISENKKYLTLSDKNRLREWRLPPIRGKFLDYHGNTIAGNLEVYQLHVIPEQVEDFKYLMVIFVFHFLKYKGWGLKNNKCWGLSIPDNPCSDRSHLFNTKLYFTYI